MYHDKLGKIFQKRAGGLMQFPNLRTYMAAVSDLKNINIPFFQSKSMQIYLNRRGVPYMSVGGFGVVFRFKDKQDNQFALKCFTSSAPGRAERYKALHDTLQITRFPFMVDFQYVDDGIRVGNESYPVVVMEWGRGAPLDAAISADLEDDGKLQNAPLFAGSLYRIVKTLQEWKMSHGDLQEGNLLVDDQNRLTLIDYDGMFVPALEGQEANEVGLANYQHPKRKNPHFGPTLDDFALLSILFQLSVIDRDRWNTHHNDRQLILNENDYRKPGKSKQIQEALTSREAHVRILAKLLANACGKNPLQIGAIESLQKEHAVLDWLEIPSPSGATESYTSIIAQILSLTEAQVESYENKNIPEQIPGPVPVAKKTRGREDGNWGFVTNIKHGLVDLFFETEEQELADDATKLSKGGLFSKFKEKVVDLFYEEESVTPAPTTVIAAPPSVAVPAHEEIQAAPPVPEKNQSLETENLDPKTAKKPEWMKQRRRK